MFQRESFVCTKPSQLVNGTPALLVMKRDIIFLLWPTILKILKQIYSVGETIQKQYQNSSVDHEIVLSDIMWKKISFISKLGTWIKKCFKWRSVHKYGTFFWFFLYWVINLNFLFRYSNLWHVKVLYKYEIILALVFRPS